MKNQAIIKLIEKELNVNKGTDLESGLKHILGLIQGNEQSNIEIEPDNEEFRDLLGKDIWIKDDYFCKHNILYLGVASYTDKYNGWYKFSVNERINPRHMNKCPNNKSRSECIFTREDVKNIFYKNLNNWIERYSDKNFCLDLSNLENAYNKTCLVADYDVSKGYFRLEEAKIRKGSMLYPIEICTNGMSYRFKENYIPTEEFKPKNWSSGASRFFGFCEEDYNEIIKLLENMYDDIQ